MSEGHGWVKPRADGLKARCGGPALCRVCREEQLAIAIQALRDVADPIAMLKRDVPPGHTFDGLWACRLAEFAGTYQDIARRALRELGEE